MDKYKARTPRAPLKRWNDTETRQLIEFLKNNELEKPVGRVYYNNFIEQYGMDTKWKLVRSKVSNMRVKVVKAIEWKRHSASPLMNEREVQDALQRMCPYFNELYDIFSRNNRLNDALEQTEELNYSIDTRQSQDSTSDLSSEIKIEAEEITGEPERTEPADTENDSLGSVSNDVGDEHLKTQEDVSKIDTESNVIWLHGRPITSGNRSRVSSSNTSSHPKRPRWNNSRPDAVSARKESIFLQRARLALEQKKFELERKKLLAEQQERQRMQNAEFELKEKQLAYEKEKTIQEFELKQREIEKEERLKMFEIESKERITLKELEYKYKIKSEK